LIFNRLKICLKDKIYKFSRKKDKMALNKLIKSKKNIAKFAKTIIFISSKCGGVLQKPLLVR